MVKKNDSKYGIQLLACIRIIISILNCDTCKYSGVDMSWLEHSG